MDFQTTHTFFSTHTTQAMNTTQHSVAPQFDNANRITAMFVQGAVCWNVAGDSRLCIVISFPDDFKIKAINNVDDIVVNGVITSKFADMLTEFNVMLGERATTAGSQPSSLTSS